MKLYSEVLEVLAYVEEEGGSLQNRRQACRILSNLKTYEFVFYLHLDMAEFYVGARNRRTTKTNEYRFKVEIFNTVVDAQIVEFGERFSEKSTQLLECMGALSPCNSFAKFDIEKLLKLGKMYKNDFNDVDIRDLEGQLLIYHHTCIREERFTSLKGISELSRLMVETGRHEAYPLVYKLIKLALVLPVATATVERCFSKMKLVKTDLHNKIGDDFLNDALVCNVEKEALVKVKLEDVMKRFTKMCVRKGEL